MAMIESLVEQIEARYADAGRQFNQLAPAAKLAEEWRRSVSDAEGAQEMLDEGMEDPELREELRAARERIEELEEEIRLAMVEADPNDDKNVIVEVRGDGAFSRFKYEGGTHRVQRVPATESQGRIHTSTATVAVLPEAEDVEVEVDQNDLEIDVYRSSGPGGQSVNTTDSAVRITHKPTGLVVSMQDEKSQLQNREKAMRVLRARLLEQELAARQAEQAADRRSQVGTGERSEKIRTYNFPQDRVTDHRVKLTKGDVARILDGGLDELTATLEAEEKRRKLEASSLVEP